MDGGNAPGVLGQAGYAITGSGGGGAGGRYVFAGLAELDGVIAEWEALRDRIRGRGETLSRAISMIEPPADDLMSRLQANTAAHSLERAQEHRQAMEDYATSYVEKLRAAGTVLGYRLEQRDPHAPSRQGLSRWAGTW